MILTRHVLRFIIPAAYDLLPPRSRSLKASALLLAIGLQESGFAHRRQLPRPPSTTPGPARSLWQYEPGTKAAIALMLKHPRVGPIVSDLATRLGYEADRLTLYYASEHNDVLACGLARCNLLTLPAPLPGPTDQALGWGQYLAAWNPGRPRADDWPANFAVAWGLIETLTDVEVIAHGAIPKNARAARTADAGDRDRGSGHGAAEETDRPGGPGTDGSAT
jgi:hypothetical protein